MIACIRTSDWSAASATTAAALLALASGACAATEPGHTFAVIEENGVPVAVNSGVPKYEGEIFTYEKVLEIRADPDNEASQLYQPNTFTLGADGRYYVADSGNNRIAVFDGEGGFVRSIGRAGEGPGELDHPFVAEWRDGVVVVFDVRTSRFTPDGTFIDAISVPRPPVYRASDGLLVSFEYPQGPRDDGYYYFGVNAQVTDRAGNAVATIEVSGLRFAKLTGQGRGRTELHFAGRPYVQYVATDEILATSGQDPVVSWYGLDGNLKRQMRIDLESLPVSAEDRALVEEHYDRLIESARSAGSLGESLVERLLAEKASLEYADRKAFWRTAMPEGTGWLWLRLPIPDVGVYVVGTAQIVQRQSFRIVSPEGEYIGITSWPPEARYFGAHLARGHLLSMIPDPVTEETIPTVYEIRPVVPGLEYPGIEVER